MTTTLSNTSTNSHIALLESVFAQAKTPVEWLVIAHNDSRMIQSLSASMTGESVAILELSQDLWATEEQELVETIEWALQQGSVGNLLFAGHSQPGGSKSRASLVDEGGKTQSSYGRLLAGVRRSNAQIQNAQQKIAAQVQRMSQVPVVHSRWVNAELTIYGLFYRAEDGVFLAYDADNDKFRPLV